MLESSKIVCSVSSIHGYVADAWRSVMWHYVRICTKLCCMRNIGLCSKPVTQPDSTCWQSVESEDLSTKMLLVLAQVGQKYGWSFAESVVPKLMHLLWWITGYVPGCISPGIASSRILNRWICTSRCIWCLHESGVRSFEHVRPGFRGGKM